VFFNLLGTSEALDFIIVAGFTSSFCKKLSDIF
jgi:hypothetical protein